MITVINKTNTFFFKYKKKTYLNMLDMEVAGLALRASVGVEAFFSEPAFEPVRAKLVKGLLEGPRTLLLDLLRSALPKFASSLVRPDLGVAVGLPVPTVFQPSAEAAGALPPWLLLPWLLF
jgi:hypothetical protein